MTITLRVCLLSRANVNISELTKPAELKRLKETYTQQLHDLNKSKPKDKGDEGLLENLARLDASLGVARDDLVSPRPP